MRMKVCLMIMTAVFMLSGCQFIRIDKAAFVTEVPLRYNAASDFIFNPEGKEVFAFKVKSKEQQKMGYVRFCANTYRNKCRNRLSYLRYLGMKGYFDTAVAVKSDGENYEYFPVVLENGEKFYFLSLQRDGGKYGNNSPISSVSLMTNYVVQPMVKNSKTEIVGEYNSFGKQYYLLNNNRVIENQQLQYIRTISSTYAQSTKIADLLLETLIDYNKEYGAYLIQPNASNQNSDVRLILGINQSSSWLRFKVSHQSDSELSLHGYTLIADDLKWRSPALQFAVLVTAKQVSETFEIVANQQELKMALALADSSRALVRLHGEHESVSQVLKEHQKKQLANMLLLSDLLAKE